MTISLDTPGVNNHGGDRRGTRSKLEDHPCGENHGFFSNNDQIRSDDRRDDPLRRQDTTENVLTKVIERDIIPRLFLAHRGPAMQTERRNDVGTTSPLADIEAFTLLVLTGEAEEIIAQVQTTIDRGVNLQRIYLDLLAPVARRLGILWEEDRCTFADVTVGLSRLQQVLREVGRRNGEGILRSTPKRRIYLVPSPGEQHTLGLSMVEEFFLHAGWETASSQNVSASSILRTLSTERIDVIGFSVASEGFFGPLMELIKQARPKSLNRHMEILVGGRFLVNHPEIVSKITGATFVSDGVNAVDAAEGLLAQKADSTAIPQPP